MDEADKTTNYCDFTVHSLGDDHVFLHIHCPSPTQFYSSFADFFFSEDRLLKYIENDQHLSFEPTRRNYVTLYKHLRLYIDDYNLFGIPADQDEDILGVIQDEYEIDSIQEDVINVRNSTMGRFGEYFLHVLLSEHFGFDCIIPKVSLTTNRNMSVFGIDSLFYSSREDMIMFGESKLTKTLTSGITLINRSLENYEKQIREEFLLILSSRLIEGNTSFVARFGNDLNECFTAKEFIRKAGIQKIGVPLFIAHGEEDCADTILSNLKSLNRKGLLGLDTIYIALSLPVLNKANLIDYLTVYIQNKMLTFRQVN